ncbi:MAG: ribonucleoside-diphosphate reductase subunit alpha, partial [Glaciimonas sp.]|nr:ribonucleoside-diphosphate reductase subunit alpha [Glaciimonas sp.]
MQSTQEISIKSSTEFGGVSSQAGINAIPLKAPVSFGDYRIIRRNGSVVGFEPSKISIAVTKAFLAVNGGQGAASARVRELVEQLTLNVVNALVRRQPTGGTFHIEDIQDQVELSLMRSGEHDVARAYVLYRAKRMEERAQLLTKSPAAAVAELYVTEDGRRRILDMNQVRDLIAAACMGLEKHVDADAILTETVKNLYDGVP